VKDKERGTNHNGGADGQVFLLDERDALVGVGVLEVLLEAGHLVRPADQHNLVDVAVVQVGLDDGLFDVRQSPVVDIATQLVADQALVDVQLVLAALLPLSSQRVS
jgi:hypothetical protein